MNKWFSPFSSFSFSLLISSYIFKNDFYAFQNFRLGRCTFMGRNGNHSGPFAEKKWSGRNVFSPSWQHAGPSADNIRENLNSAEKVSTGGNSIEIENCTVKSSYGTPSCFSIFENYQFAFNAQAESVTVQKVEHNSPFPSFERLTLNIFYRLTMCYNDHQCESGLQLVEKSDPLGK